MHVAYEKLVVDVLGDEERALDGNMLFEDLEERRTRSGARPKLPVVLAVER